MQMRLCRHGNQCLRLRQITKMYKTIPYGKIFSLQKMSLLLKDQQQSADFSVWNYLLRLWNYFQAGVMVVLLIKISWLFSSNVLSYKYIYNNYSKKIIPLRFHRFGKRCKKCLMAAGVEIFRSITWVFT